MNSCVKSLSCSVFDQRDVPEYENNKDVYLFFCAPHSYYILEEKDPDKWPPCKCVRTIIVFLTTRTQSYRLALLQLDHVERQQEQFILSHLQERHYANPAYEPVRITSWVYSC